MMEAGNTLNDYSMIDPPSPPSGARMKPLSREEWEKFTPKMQWDIKVALRGPDLYASDTTKWFTTSIIRGKMREVCRVGGLVNDDLNLIILPSHFRPSNRPNPPVMVDADAMKSDGWRRHKLMEGHQGHDSCEWCQYVEKLIEYLDMTPRFDGGHFFQHIAEAGDILSIPRIYVPLEIWGKAMKLGHIRAGFEFLAYLKSLTPEQMGNVDEYKKELKRHLKPYLRENE
jgi:hypothetical protein